MNRERTGPGRFPLIPALALLGMLVASYLTWVHYAGGGALCAGVGDCETVNTSPYAEVAGVPVALLGLGMYAALFALTLAARARPRAAEPLTAAAFGLSLAGTLYSAYLTYLEVAVIHAICPWCVVSAVLVTAIFVLTLRQVLRELPVL